MVLDFKRSHWYPLIEQSLTCKRPKNTPKNQSALEHNISLLKCISGCLESIQSTSSIVSKNIDFGRFFFSWYRGFLFWKAMFRLKFFFLTWEASLIWALYFNGYFNRTVTYFKHSNKTVGYGANLWAYNTYNTYDSIFYGLDFLKLGLIHYLVSYIFTHVHQFQCWTTRRLQYRTCTVRIELSRQQRHHSMVGYRKSGAPSL